MNNAQRKSAPCPERFCELISENHCVCGSGEHGTRLVAHMLSGSWDSEQNAGIRTIEKGKDRTPALWCSMGQNQHPGSGLVLSCWASWWAMPTSSRSCSPACVPISPMRSNASRAALRLDKSFSSPLSLSWRREISFRAAEIRKPAILSPSFLSASIPSITSCGMRIFLSCDFVFTLPVAIIPPEILQVCKQYIIRCVFKTLDMNTHLKLKSIHTLSASREQVRHKNSEARQCDNTNRASYYQRYQQ